MIHKFILLSRDLINFHVIFIGIIKKKLVMLEKNKSIIYFRN